MTGTSAEQNRTLTLATLVMLSICMSIYVILLARQEVWFGRNLEQAWFFVFSATAACWGTSDARARQVARSFDFGFYIFLLWPVTLPYYLMRTRGAFGFWVFVGFVVLYLAPTIIGGMVYVL